MEAYTKTDIGQIRKMNQDYTFYSVNQVGNLPNLYIVADGMGGHQAGDFASKYAVDKMVSYVRESTALNPVFILENAIFMTNHDLLEKSMSDDSLRGMGTTLVAATISENVLYVANVGDSRLYIINDDIVQITKDHSYVEELVSQGMLERDSLEYNVKKNIITRAMGIDKAVVPDFFETNLSKGDYMLMCSDGLTNMLEDTQIKEIVNNEDGLSQKVDKLIELANKNGGEDNITVLLVGPMN